MDGTVGKDSISTAYFYDSSLKTYFFYFVEVELNTVVKFYMSC